MSFLINPYIFADEGYLVQTYSPDAAWFFNKVSSSATNCIRVRRSSDNAEQDIGFTGDDLDTTSLASFVGANSAYLVTFYDQSGNGYDLTQSTTTAQPLIVNAGTNETLNGFVCANFDGTNDFLTGGTTILNPNGLADVYTAAIVDSTTLNDTVYARSRFASADGRYAMYGGAGNVQSIALQNAGGTDVRAGGAGAGLYNQYYDGANHALYKNNASQSSTAKTGTLGNLSTRFLMGAYNNAGDTGEQAGYHHAGKIQGLAVFLTDVSGSIGAINGNINTYYGIY